MNKNTLNGILSGGAGSLWWGIIGVLYFKSVSFVDPIELIIHRTVWTSFLLLFTVSIYSKWNDVFLVLKNIKKTLILFICGILIVTNWFTWIYAVVTNRLVDASFGYYIFPIISVFFGIIFLKESHNKKRLLAISLVIISVIYLLFNFESVPWVGLIVAATWSAYNLIRKKLKVSGLTKAKFLLISGKPIGEPIARGGPFVMNTKEEILKAVQDYHNGTFVAS